jgi:hypothetical protein
VLEGGVDREKRVGAGEAGDLVQRAARAEHQAQLPAPGGGLAVGPEQIADGRAVAARGGGQVGDDDVTPGVNAAVIWSAACSAAAASSWGEASR